MNTALHTWNQLPGDDQPLEPYLRKGLQQLLEATTGRRACLVFPAQTGQPALTIGQTAAGTPCAPADIPGWERLASGQEPPSDDRLLLSLPGIEGGWLYLEASQPLDESRRALATTFASLAALARETRRWKMAFHMARAEKAQYVSVISHELRLPMTSIKGYTDLLLKGMTGALNEMQTNFLGVIRNNVERMSGLISDLSDLSKAESGRLKMQSQAFPLAMQVQKAAETWQQACAEKKQTLHLELPADLPMVQGDPQRVAQIVSILLKNAHLYTPAGGQITVRASAAGDMVRLSVQDTGIGIASEDAEHVFEQFFRSEDQRVRDHPGWGLGLSVAQALTRLMGGEIGFESKAENGSTFWVRLPAAP